MAKRGLGKGGMGKGGLGKEGMDRRGSGRVIIQIGLKTYRGSGRRFRRISR